MKTFYMKVFQIEILPNFEVLNRRTWFGAVSSIVRSQCTNYVCCVFLQPTFIACLTHATFYGSVQVTFWRIRSYVAVLRTFDSKSTYVIM